MKRARRKQRSSAKQFLKRCAAALQSAKGAKRKTKTRPKRRPKGRCAPCERLCLSRSPGYLNKGILAVGFRHGTAGDGDDRQGYRGPAGNLRAVVASAR